MQPSASVYATVVHHGASDVVTNSDQSSASTNYDDDLILRHPLTVIPRQPKVVSVTLSSYCTNPLC